MLSGVWAKITGATAIGILIASAVALALFVYQQSQISRLEENNKVLHANNALLEESITKQGWVISSMEEKIRQTIETNNLLIERLSIAERERENRSAELKSYHGRLENVAEQKPSLVGNLATDATADILRRIGEATGSDSQAAGNR